MYAFVGDNFPAKLMIYGEILWATFWGCPWICGGFGVLWGWGGLWGFLGHHEGGPYTFKNNLFLYNKYINDHWIMMNANTPPTAWTGSGKNSSAPPNNASAVYSKLI